jgi:acyl-CoA reductase-like NAD-dependent aldehyde dehydrogenase
VKAARAAFVSWADTDIQYRQKALLALAERLFVDKELISGIICKETGKSVRKSTMAEDIIRDKTDANSRPEIPWRTRG